MITSCNVHNFRCFKNLHAEGLKRFTFIVGSSGSGKTAFLESLFLTGGSSAEIYLRIRRWRGLGESGIQLTGTRASFESLFRDMFHNFEQSEGLDIRFNDSDRGWRSIKVYFGEKSSYELPLKTRAENMFLTLPIHFKWETPERVFNSTIRIEGGEMKIDAQPEVFPLIFISPRTASAVQDAQRFSELSRLNRADPVIAAIRRIFPEVQTITLESVAGELVLHAAVEGFNEKIPLVDLSGGVNKYLSIVLCVLMNKEGTLLIDEMENGFYYQNLDVILDSIFDLCDQHEVQLIASTHSYEFLQALVRAMELRGQDGKGFSCLRFERPEGQKLITNQPAVRMIEGAAMKAAIEQNFEVR